MKFLFAFFAVLISHSAAFGAAASSPSSPEAFARQLVALVRAAPSEYRDRRGAITYQDANIVLYQLTAPSSDIRAETSLVRTTKDGQRPYLFFGFHGADSMTRVQTLFAALPAIFAASDSYQDFTADAALTPLRDGRQLDLVYYRGITVAKLILSAKHDGATVSVGFLESEDLNADLIKFAGGPAPVVEPKTWGSAWADAIMGLQHSANRNYDGIVGTQMKRADGTPYLAAPSLLGADESRFYRYEAHGLVLSLSYYKTNRSRSTVEKDARALFSQLLKSGRYQQGSSGENFTFIMEQDREILSVWFTPEKSDPKAVEIFIYQTPPMADEASYHGKFPTELTDTSEPQIVEVRGQGATADSFLRCNGIFKEGILIKGYKTYSGYSDFLDGVWFSDDWIPSYGNYDVVFHPAYSRDVVYGKFRDSGDMSTFSPDRRYEGKDSGLRPDSPGWLLVTFAEHEKKSLTERRKDFDNSVVMRDGFPYRGGPLPPGAEETEIYAALDRVRLQAQREFSGVSLGPKPDYAKTTESHEAAGFAQADRHYVFASSRFTPTYVAEWNADNPAVETVHRAVRNYLLRLQASGQGKITTNYGELRFYTRSASITVNGVKVSFDYNNSDHPESLLSVGIGTHREYNAGSFTQNNNSSSTSRSSVQPTQTFPVHMHTCPTCEGRGRVLKTDRYGNKTTDVFPTCNGQREVPN
jgi:hypothetical protein